MGKEKSRGNKNKSKAVVIPADLDLSPDAWSKFEKLVKSAAKMGPKPRTEKRD
jgi:hypothetical protein